MCLMIHKPAGIEIPPDLIRAAAALNRDGWGLMGFDADRRVLLERQLKPDVPTLLNRLAALRNAEYVLHLRRRTRGAADLRNVHPLKVVGGLHLMHNGTLGFRRREPGRSDSWQLAAAILRPLAQRHPSLLADNAFHQLLELGLRPENKLALLDERTRRIVILNRVHGAEFEGLWLSNTRWIDRAQLQLSATPQPQERSYRAGELRFL